MAFTNYFKVISVFLFLGVIRDSETIDCPNPEVIWPCTCNFYERVYCKNIENLTQILTGISKYFKAEFSLHLSLKSNVLPAKFLGTFRTSQVEIIETPLEDVDDDAFEGHEETLKRLAVSDTKLKSISAFKLKKLKKLIMLDIHRTKTITSVRKEDIMELPKSIIILSICSTSISYIDAGSFQQLPNLKSLTMDRNQLASVPEKSLPAGLESISFGMNRFDHIPMHVYKECPKLEYLTIPSNNISQIPKELEDIMESREVITDLTGNPVSCGCDLMWLGKYNDYDYKGKSYNVFGVCNGNNSRHGVLLQRLTKGSFDDCYHH
ncbi:Uncharacterised protein r2_g1039 [Pycnogonum litorale]